ncbi:hypothetical protein [Roseibacillus ishigakijimensis]|uniref:Uncharacterized protein n=1 Tax=Roseibacillus ishigakijimensis TaxID=454146 RepID=A0A934VHF7_9BACT|nr:hypothetical protein [Roseibacillus ishigakijimensis]MBK1833898.1 hypothetical protein [Roseibacillus ishigakijimensis]
MIKRVFGIIFLLLGVGIYLAGGRGPLEGPVGLTLSLLGGSFCAIAGAILIGKSVLEGNDWE